MPLLKCAPEQIIYDVKSHANEVALLIKGSVSLLTGHNNITLRAGDIIGVTEVPGAERRFAYKANEEVTLYTYPYQHHEDIISLLYENEKLSSTIASRLIKLARELRISCKKLHKEARTEYENISNSIKNYPQICAKNGKSPQPHPEVENLESPDLSLEISPWKNSFFRTLSEHDDSVFSLLTLGADACAGFAMSALEYIEDVSEEIQSITSSVNDFNHKIMKFKMEVDLLKTNASAIESGEKELTMPNFENSLAQILVYSEVDETTTAQITRSIDSYASIEERSDTNDTLRTIRRKIAADFYKVYEGAFKKFIEDPAPSPIIKMFLMFGFMDERLVEREDLESIYEKSLSYIPDPNGRIVTIFEWLQKVYSMEVEPSLNEFQLEYIAYLRESKQNGDISEEKMKQMIDDPDSRLTYEIKNIFTLGNRMTFGRISLFLPIFDSQLRMLPLDKSYISHERITTELDRVRSTDFTCFYREKIYTLPPSKALNDNMQLFIHEEQTPFLILFPVIGSRFVLWQNIEGRKRNTPCRMLLPIFFEEDITDHFTTLCGEYRWEVCKTDQGVHWNDITDPSLTAEYNDFLQFYKKNSQLSADHKEKIKTAIKKYQNNYKRVFVADYLAYMKYESQGNMRLMKHQREMLFKYCPFGPDVRTNLTSIPQYESLIERRHTKQEQKTRPLKNIAAKMEHVGEEPPTELLEEIAYLDT